MSKKQAQQMALLCLQNAYGFDYGVEMVRFLVTTRDRLK